MRVSRGPVAVILDPGWLYLLPGVALVAAGVLIPSHERLEEVRWQRARAEALRGHLQEKLDRHEQYLQALERGGETVLLSLAAGQLNMVPTGTDPMVAGPTGSGASVFEALEPPPPELPTREVAESRLRRLAIDARARVWLLAGGLMAVFIGLLPRTAVRSELAEREEEELRIREGLALARERAEAMWRARGEAALGEDGVAEAAGADEDLAEGDEPLEEDAEEWDEEDELGDEDALEPDDAWEEGGEVEDEVGDEEEDEEEDGEVEGEWDDEEEWEEEEGEDEEDVEWAEDEGEEQVVGLDESSTAEGEAEVVDEGEGEEDDWRERLFD